MDDIERRFELLEGEHREDHDALAAVQIVLMGPNRDNGLRSEVKELKERFYKYIDGRRATCIGLEECAKIWVELASREEEDSNVKVAEIQAGAATTGTKILAFVQVLGPILTFAGVIFLAFIKK